MKFVLTSVSFLMIFCCFAQETLVRSNGDSIVVFDDGTWKPYLVQVELEKNTSLVGDVVAERLEDAMTGDVRISTPTWWVFGKSEIGGNLTGNMMYFSDLLVWKVVINTDLGCLSEYSSKILVKLEDDSIIEFSQISDTDCSDSPNARFIPVTRDELKGDDLALVKNLNAERMEALLSQKWKMIRVHGTEYYSDYFPHSKRNAEPDQFFMQHISAIKRKQ